MLWVRGYFWVAELLLIINFFNLTSLYFRHSTTPRFVHIPVVSAPYAWTFVAILWNGAAMVHAQSLAARILANIAIWSILGFGCFFLLTFKDYTMGLELAILSLCKSMPLYDRAAGIMLTVFSPCAGANGDPCNRVTMDLCFRHHGLSSRALAPYRRPGYAWREWHTPRRRGGRLRSRTSAAARRPLIGPSL